MSATATAPSVSIQRESHTDAKKSTFETNASQSQRSEALNQESIAHLAYALWELRGCPSGSPEEDWFAAEQKMRESQR